MNGHTSRLVQVIGACVLALAGSAHAESIVTHYGMNRIGAEYDYRGMGYNDPSGNFVSLAGADIVSSTLILDFKPAAGVDISTLYMGMVIPTTSANQFFAVYASDLVEIAPGDYHYELTTDAFNGTIFDAHFAVESYGMDDEGNPISLAGVVSADSGYYYTVEIPGAVPEPASAALMLAGLGLVPLVACRRARRQVAA